MRARVVFFVPVITHTTAARTPLSRPRYNKKNARGNRVRTLPPPPHPSILSPPLSLSPPSSLRPRRLGRRLGRRVVDVAVRLRRRRVGAPAGRGLKGGQVGRQLGGFGGGRPGRRRGHLSGSVSHLRGGEAPPCCLSPFCLILSCSSLAERARCGGGEGRRKGWRAVRGVGRGRVWGWGGARREGKSGRQAKKKIRPIALPYFFSRSVRPAMSAPAKSSNYRGVTLFRCVGVTRLLSLTQPVIRARRGVAGSARGVCGGALLSARSRRRETGTAPVFAQSCVLARPARPRAPTSLSPLPLHTLSDTLNRPSGRWRAQVRGRCGRWGEGGRAAPPPPVGWLAGPRGGSGRPAGGRCDRPWAGARTRVWVRVL